MITLDKYNTEHFWDGNQEPILIIDTIQFISSDENWLNRLSTTRLTFIKTGVDEKGQEITSTAAHLVLGQFITPKQDDSVLRIDNQIEFKNLFGYLPNDNYERWKASVELYDIELQDNERLIIDLEIKENKKAKPMQKS